MMHRILQFLFIAFLMANNFACANKDTIGPTATMPVISPTGDKVAFVSDIAGGVDLWTANVDGTGLQKLTEGFRVWNPKWSPDEKKIVFASDKGGSLGIWILNTSDVSLFYVVDNGYTPNWSPDGNRIVFSTKTGDLCIINADGTNKTTLGNFLAGSPAWSPNGTKLVFQCNYEPDFWNLWLINVDGTGLTQLTEKGYKDWNPFWVSDKKIIFSSNRGQERQVWSINIDGTICSQVTFDSSMKSFPSYSKVQRKIICEQTSDLIGDNIFIMDENGNNARPITSFKKTTGSPI